MPTTDPISGGVISQSLYGLPVADDVQAFLENTWTDWSASMVITAGTTPPTKGNSTYLARWKLLNQHTVMTTCVVTIGSTWAAGSGAPYFFSLPIAPADTEAYGAFGSAYFFDSSTSQEYLGVARIAVGKGVLYIPQQNGTTTSNTPVRSGQVSPTYPAPPAVGDIIKYSIAYEV